MSNVVDASHRKAIEAVENALFPTVPNYRRREAGRFGK